MMDIISSRTAGVKHSLSESQLLVSRRRTVTMTRDVIPTLICDLSFVGTPSLLGGRDVATDADDTTRCDARGQPYYPLRAPLGTRCPRAPSELIGDEGDVWLTPNGEITTNSMLGGNRCTNQ